MAWALVAGLTQAALAQGVPIPPPPPPRPILAAPALPTSPVGRALAGAYGSIVRTGVTDPAAAQRASFAYAQALERARAGDISGALAASAHAQAQALETGGSSGSVPAVLSAPAGVTPSTAGVPIVDAGGAALSPELLVARNEIVLASQLTHHSLAAARAHYRAALAAYDSGNRRRARSEARASFDSAAEALSRVK